MIIKFENKFIYILLGGLVITVIFLWLAIFAKAQNGLLEVDFFDIGQGKAIFIKTPDNNKILIDGGPDNSVLEKLGAHLPYFDRQIDLVILTHPDSDHLNGLIEAAKRYSIGRIIETGIADQTAQNQAWENLIKEKKIPVIFASAGQKIKIGEAFLLQILYPVANIVGQTFSNTNSSSIVARLDYGKNSFLFTGDAEGATESYLVGSGENIDADILDVGHHGSKNSTSEEFLQKVTPETAVIQVGVANRYGHPAPETLERLNSVSSKTYRTDLCGDVDIFSDGQKYSVQANCQ